MVKEPDLGCIKAAQNLDIGKQFLLFIQWDLNGLILTSIKNYVRTLLDKAHGPRLPEKIFNMEG